MENPRAIYGKIHYFDWAIFQFAMFVYQRVIWPEQIQDQNTLIASVDGGFAINPGIGNDLFD